MLLQAFAFVMGALLTQSLATLPDECYTQLLPLGALLWLRIRRTRAFTAALLLVALGAIYAAGEAHLKLRAVDAVLDGPPDVIVTGSISSFVVAGAKSSAFEFRSSQIGHHTRHLSLRVRWYGKTPPLAPGQRWRLRLRIKPVTVRFNPGGFDRAGWLWQRGVLVSAYVRDSSEANRLADAHWSLSRWRQQLAERLNTLVGNVPRAGLVKALLIGDRRAVDESERQVMQRTGTAHLLAISGLHIGLAATFGFVFTGTLWRRAWRAPERVATSRVAAPAAFVTAFVYAGLAGFALPTVRALVMCAVVLGALMLRRRVHAPAALALAVFTLILTSPASAASSGFWLSCGAVAALLFGLQARTRGTRLGTLLHAQWVAAIGLAPLAILYFGQAPGSGFAANAVAVPLVGGLVVPLLLTGGCALAFSDALAATLLGAGAQLLDWLFWFLEWLAAADIAVRASGTPTNFGLLAAALGSVLLLTRLPGSWLGVFMWLPLLVAGPQAPAFGALRVTALDVGQGLAVLVRTHQHVLLFDTGPRFGEWSAAQSSIMPALRARGISSLDVLLVSHADNDHAGGTRAMLSALPVGLLIGDPGADSSTASAATTRPCRAGQSWNWDGVRFSILHPGPGLHRKRNNRSCVLKVSTPTTSVLLPGDIESRAETDLLTRVELTAKDELKADILIVPHHGSRTSSTAAFVQRVGASHVIFPTGAANRYGLPHPDVVERYRRSGARILDTAVDGAVTVQIAGKDISVHTEALDAKRYWHIGR